LVAFRSLVEAHARLLATLDVALSRAHGMGFSDFQVLLALVESGVGELRLSELAERTLVSRSALSRRIDSLVGAGWVRRRTCPTDRRGTFAVLTDEGRARFREALPTHDAVLEHMLVARLAPAKLVELSGLLDRVATLEDSAGTQMLEQ
jgi:DNA-binding MarR family transcriptional regulator